MSELSRIRHVVLDMDGTLYKGTKLFPQTLPFLDRLAQLGIGRTFLTNNTSHSKLDYVARLKRMDINARAEEICTPAESVVAHLRSRHQQLKRIAILGTRSLVDEFEASGFVSDWEMPEAVVVGFDTGLDYGRLCRTAYWIDRGLPFLATHPDLVCPTDQPTVLVDCGAICACLTAATGKKPVVFGKPNPSILTGLLDRLQLKLDELLMVGDRIYTDIKMARDAGVPSALVLSGETQKEHVDSLTIIPDFIVRDIGLLGEMLASARLAPNP